MNRLDNGGGIIEAIAILLRQLAENIKMLPEGAALDAAVGAYVALCDAVAANERAYIAELTPKQAAP
jgi:hypothetical protein